MSHPFRIAKNTLFLTLSQALIKIINFAYIAMLARWLGADLFGEYSTVVTLVAFATLIADGGITTLTIRDVARDKGQTLLYFANGLVARTGSALAIYFCLILAGWLLGYSPTILMLVALAGLAILPSTLAGGVLAIYNAHEQMELPALLTGGLYILTALFGIVGLLAGFGVAGALFATVLASLIYFTVAWKSTERFISIGWHTHIRWIVIRQIVGDAIPYTVRFVLIMLYARADIVLLSKLSTFKEVGTYQAAYKILEASIILPGVLNSALFPLVSNLYTQSKDRLRSIFEKQGLYLCILVLPVVAVLLLLAESIMVLIYGHAYRAGADILRVLTIAILFMYLDAPVTNLMSSSNLQVRVTLLSVLTMSVNVGLNLLLIPYLGGVGAAWATVGSELATIVIFYPMAVQYLGRTLFWRNMVRPAFALLVGASVALISLWIEPFLAVSGLIVYIVMLRRLNVISSEDREIFGSMLTQVRERIFA